MNKRSKRTSNNRGKKSLRPKRRVLRQGDFEVVARGVHREDPDIKRLSQATWDVFFQSEIDKIREKYERESEEIERGLEDIDQ